MELCPKRPCVDLITIRNDHFHDGTTDVNLYEIKDDVVLFRNYPRRLDQLRRQEGFIRSAEYRWHSCSFATNPDPRKRFALFFNISMDNQTGTAAIYDVEASRDTIEYVRRCLGVQRKSIKNSEGKRVTVYIDKTGEFSFGTPVGVKYKH